MSSILTNNTAMAALQNLSATQKSLAQTQGQISSGLKVAQASDNAAYWSISTTMKSDTSALSAVSDALNLGSSVVSTATSAVSSVLSILNKIKADVVTAQQPGTDASQVQTDITAQQQSLASIVGSASFNGVNLLDGSTATSTAYGSAAGHVDFIASYNRTTSGGSTSSVTLDTTKTNLLGSGGILTGTPGGSGTTNISTMSVAGATPTQLAAYGADIDAAIKSVTAVGATLGSTSTTLNNQASFVTSLSDAITSGVGSLVDADMNVASTRLQALQTQQQLGIQALSIANQNSQLILKLFG
jgi:flagellin